MQNFSNPNFIRHLELAIQYGKPYLFEDLDEEIDPMIDPILERLTFVENNQAGCVVMVVVVERER